MSTEGVTPKLGEVFTVLRAWLIQALPNDVPVLQARQNNVPAPKDSYLLMSAEASEGLCQPSRSYADGCKITKQIVCMDFSVTTFGPIAEEMIARISATFLKGSTRDWFLKQNELVIPLNQSAATRASKFADRQEYLVSWQMTLQLQVAQIFSESVETALSGSIQTIQINEAEKE